MRAARRYHHQHHHRYLGTGAKSVYSHLLCSTHNSWSLPQNPKNKAQNAYKQRQLRHTDLHLASRCLYSSSNSSSSCGEGCVGEGGMCQVLGPDKSKLFARCCWFSVAAGWVAAEGKQTKCHSLPAREEGVFTLDGWF